MAFFMNESIPCSPLPGVVTPCRKYSGKTTSRAGSSRISHAEIDHPQCAFKIYADAVTILRDVNVAVA
jgi:hypothetical protein